MIKSIIKFIDDIVLDGVLGLFIHILGWLGSFLITLFTWGRAYRDPDDWTARFVGFALLTFCILAILYSHLTPIAQVASP